MLYVTENILKHLMYEHYTYINIYALCKFRDNYFS